MSFKQKAKKKLCFAKIFKSKASKKDDSSEDSLAKDSSKKRTGENEDEFCKDFYGKQCSTDSQQSAQCSSEFRRFQRSKDYHRRRNGMTEKDHFEFLRLKMKRVQQQIIDTYVYGWR